VGIFKIDIKNKKKQRKSLAIRSLSGWTKEGRQGWSLQCCRRPSCCRKRGQRRFCGQVGVSGRDTPYMAKSVAGRRQILECSSNFCAYAPRKLPLSIPPHVSKASLIAGQPTELNPRGENPLTPGGGDVLRRQSRDCDLNRFRSSISLSLMSITCMSFHLSAVTSSQYSSKTSSGCVSIHFCTCRLSFRFFPWMQLARSPQLGSNIFNKCSILMSLRYFGDRFSKTWASSLSKRSSNRGYASTSSIQFFQRPLLRIDW